VEALSGRADLTVSEHAIALMMTVVRMIGPAVRGAAERVWQPVPAHEVSGCTLAGLGLGSIAGVTVSADGGLPLNTLQRRAHG